MAIELISKIKPKNNGNFKLVDAADVEVTGNKNLQTILELIGADEWDGSDSVVTTLETHLSDTDSHLTTSEKTALGSLISASPNLIETTDVVNNLTSDSTDTPLSAAQGKVLKGLIDGKGTGTGDMLKSEYATNGAAGKVDLAEEADHAAKATEADHATSATYLGNYTAASFIKTNDIVDNLTSTATNKPLSANQGKKLAEQIANAGGGDMLASVYADASKTGYVKNATNADTAASATAADWAEEAAYADEAASADDAAKLGGKLPSHYAKQESYVTVMQLIQCLCTPISFTIDGNKYSVPQGFTWNEWVKTDNNQDGYEVYADGKLYTEDQHAVINQSTNKQCLGTDAIQSGKKYISQ